MARHWVKLYVRTGRALAAVLSDREWATLTRLALYTRYRDNTIRTDDGTPASMEWIASLLGRSVRQTREIVRTLVARGAIRRERVGRHYVYRISEAVCYRGATIDDLSTRRTRRRSGRASGHY